ncbi:MAG: thiol oxidoreductase [Alphaproteobacteria bacterium]|nr:thiol oxidoreductase [Alphaproteobacteria bacterium]
MENRHRTAGPGPRRAAAGVALLCAALLCATAPGRAQTVERVPAGGATTQDSATREAFSLPAANMPPDRVRDFFLGNRLFNTVWTVAPGSARSFDGLGPTFNAEGCAGCHVRDGRGRPPEDANAPMDSMLVRLSLRGGGPHPAYGDQIQHRAIPGVLAEGRVALRTDSMPGQYGDGTPYVLRRPSYSFRDGAFGPLNEGAVLSPRVAGTVFGMGLLEAVPDAALLAMADPEDADGDGISGRVNRVRDDATGRTVLGRFGWKAAQPSLRQQIAAALRDDIGITSPLYPDENCPPPQVACRAAPTGGKPEAHQAFIDMLTFYMETLAVPATRDEGDPEAARGRALFDAIGCAGCHRPVLRSGPHSNPVVAHQAFAPYTDLLLHDMGEALADGRPDFDATGREWRTPPLWGLGLIRRVNGHRRLLHDGRADGAAEAILWHGGEGARAREAFRALPAPDRAALLRFLDRL